MSDETAEPVLRVVKGEPTAEELAALVAVVSARAVANSAAAARTGGDRSDGDQAEGRASDWASYWRKVRQPLQHGPGRWRASAHPR